MKRTFHDIFDPSSQMNVQKTIGRLHNVKREETYVFVPISDFQIFVSLSRPVNPDNSSTVDSDNISREKRLLYTLFKSICIYIENLLGYWVRFQTSAHVDKMI